MKRWLGLALVVFVGTAGWRIGSSLSPDALSMALGVLFGVMAGIPAALLVMAGSRRSSDRRYDEVQRGQMPPQAQVVPMIGPGYPQAGYPQAYRREMPYAQQPPVIVIAGPQGLPNTMPFPQTAPQNNLDWFPPDLPDRNFTMVGEEMVEEWQ